MTRALPILLLVATLASCAYPWGRARDPWGDPWGDPRVPSAERERRDPREGVARKKVTAKQEHTLLVAYDGSECQVSPERWKKIGVGDALWCYWRVEDGGLERPPSPGPGGRARLR